MIRLATPEDAGFVSAVGVAAGMFPADDTQVTDTMMETYFAKNSAGGHGCFIDELDETGERVAMAYVEPVRATDRTFELLMIAVDPRYQGRGRGTRLLEHVEKWLGERQQRLLLVQTSGEDSYAQTRAFYEKNGYLFAARVPDYYTHGVDMVMFRKPLPQNAESLHV
jgi:ribosomal protein S18 acetylase RimI-like enzyme